MSHPARLTLADLADLRLVLVADLNARNLAAVRRVAGRVPPVGAAGLQGPPNKHEAPPPARDEASTTTSLTGAV